MFHRHCRTTAWSPLIYVLKHLLLKILKYWEVLIKFFECLSFLGLPGDDNENKDAMVLDEDDDEIPKKLDEIKDRATPEFIEDEAEDVKLRNCHAYVSFTCSMLHIKYMLLCQHEAVIKLLSFVNSTSLSSPTTSMFLFSRLTKQSCLLTIVLTPSRRSRDIKWLRNSM